MDNMLGFWGEETLDNAVNRMKAKGAEFSRAYNQHLANYNVVKSNPQLLSEWQTIKTYADKTKAVIQAVNNSVDKSVNWFKDVFGLGSNSLNGLQQVGIVPVLSLAYILSGINGMDYIISKIWAFSTKAKQYNDFMATKPTAEQIIKYKQTTQEVGILGNISNITKWAVIGGALYFAWKKWGKNHGN
jgi:hypothetical protein